MRANPRMRFIRSRQALLLAVATLALLSVASTWAAWLSSAQPLHFANADDRGLTTQGAHAYVRQCGPCHGRHLQGQPFWQLVDEDTGRRAPALDQTGRAWRRSDEDLFHIVKYGRYPERPENYKSHMPAFGDQLEDSDILAILAFVKARWPVGQRALHALTNPGSEGMPSDAEKSDWRLPPNCFPHDVVAVAQQP
jgi:S-disulfanyl-L-cysteine oxidoreductase SoxD